MGTHGTGAREEELCSLTADRVEAGKGHYIFHVKDAKTKAGSRYVAVTHPAPLAVLKGLQGAQQVFPELTPGGLDKKFSACAVKAYGRYRRACGVPDSTDFRRNVITVVEAAGVGQVPIARFVGHKVGTMAADTYSAGGGKALALEVAGSVRFSETVERLQNPLHCWSTNMPVDLNLPETAKALSGPVTKLVEVVAAGCGRLYEPRGIKKRAEAEGEALVIMEEARSRVRAVSLRAAQRLLDVEERRQQNIESIAAEAVKALPDDVSPTPVDLDWCSRFFSECQDVSSQEMQRVWAKLLAGEVARPGSFSQRTLQVLRNLAREEAEHFNVLCRDSFRIGQKRAYPLVAVEGNQQYWDDLGLTFSTIQRLADAGLVTHHSVSGLRIPGAEVVLLQASPDTGLQFISKSGTQDFALGKVALTTAGSELAEVCEWEVSKVRQDTIRAHFADRFTVTRVRVEEVAGGGLKLTDLPEEDAS